MGRPTQVATNSIRQHGVEYADADREAGLQYISLHYSSCSIVVLSRELPSMSKLAHSFSIFDSDGVMYYGRCTSHSFRRKASCIRRVDADINHGAIDTAG